MASILRSSKFVRYIAGFARNVVLNTPREFDGNLVNTTQCLCGAIPRTLTAQASVQHDQNLERSLKRLDQDVRRSGRISRRDIEDILEEIRNSRSATSSQSLLVIRCCGNLVPEELPEVRTKLVQEIWNTLNKLNIPLDISHYNALLRVYLENEHFFSPTEFLSELESKGIEPNRVTYQRLIARYCQDGDIEGATKILEFMREKQLPVNENVFNALIVGHSQSGDMDSAEGILGVMAQAGLEPSADTYTTLLCGYAKKGDIETINKIINECEAKEIHFLDKDYLDIAYSLAINGHAQHVPVMIEKTRKAVGYNHDAVNIILRLINKGQEDAAYTILKTMPRANQPDGSTAPSGTFFIRQLIKAKLPAERIIKYCDLFESEQLNEQALLLATEYSLHAGNESLAYKLLEEVSKRGLPIRQHYFWPLIVAKANDPTGESIIEVLLNMQEFNITPNTETIREYVMPHLKGSSSEILAQLRKANISIGLAASNLALNLLNKGDIKEAAAIVSCVPAYYAPDYIKRPLCAAFEKTKDADSFITILRHVYENVDRRDLIKIDEGRSAIDKSEMVGIYLFEIARKREFLNNAETILSKLVEEGLGISVSTAEKVQTLLGDNMTSEISSLLAKLSSGELTPVPLVRKLPSYTPSSQMNIPQLEMLIKNLEAKNQDTKNLKRQLFNLYYRSKELTKMEALLKELEKDGFECTPGVYAQLIDVYAYHDKLDETVLNLQKLNEIEPGYKLDKTKIIRVIQMFVKNDKFNDAINFINELQKGEQEIENSFSFNSQVWQLFNLLAVDGRADDLNTLFNLLVEKELVEVNNAILGPLIKVHLVNNDIDSAISKFEWCVTQYKATPFKSDLSCKLIQSEDAEKLQHLTDLSTTVHGEINSLYDLVFAFIECGRIRQARKILETPGLQSRQRRINNICERFQQEGKIKPLEDFKTATKDLSHIDRNDIYYQLLLGYIKQEEVDKALGLWTQMQEEDMSPSDEFLHELGCFLKKNGIQIPFVMPILPVQQQEEEYSNRNAQQARTKPDITLFRNYVKNGDLNGALKIKQNSSEVFPATDLSILIEKLTQANRLSEATTLALNMLENNKLPVYRVFRFLLNKLANAGDVQSILKFNPYLNSEVKKLISFDNRVCNANLVAGKAEEYLNNLEQSIDNAKDDELDVVKEQFPRGGAIGILEKHPELLEKFETVAVKYAKRNIIGPINVLWSYYFINHIDDKADSIWKEHIQGAPRIMFQRVVQSAREKNDEDLTRKLIDHLKTSQVTEGAIGNAYSCLIDVLIAKQKNEEAVEVFEAAIKEVHINYINKTAVLRVKEVYEASGKPFNYTVPEKSHKNATSSSASSSEEEVKTTKV